MHQLALPFKPTLTRRLCAFALPLWLLAVGSTHAQSIPGYVVAPLSLMDRSNLATMRVTLNGQRTMMILDTGASGTVVDRSFYRGAPTHPAFIKKEDLPPELRNIRPNGEAAEIGWIESFKVGQADFAPGPVVVMDLSQGFGAYNNYHAQHAISGLLGEDFLHRYAAIIDWGRRGVYLNLDPTKRLKLGGGLRGAGWTAVSMAPTDARHFTVDCTVSGKPVRLIVDTGAQFTSFQSGVVPLNVIYNRDNGRSVGHLASTATSMRMIGLDSTAYPARVEHWMIGSYEVPPLKVAVGTLPPGLLKQRSAGSDAPILGLLGAEVLAQNHAIVDVGESTLYLKHN